MSFFFRFANHEKSKKHKENVSLLKQTLDHEEEVPPSLSNIDTVSTDKPVMSEIETVLEETQESKLLDKETIDTSSELDDILSNSRTQKYIIYCMIILISL